MEKEGYHGWLVVDKPKGVTSTSVVSGLKRFLPRKWKIGHGGTLDPLAEGVLPIAIGEATKTVQFAMGKTKIYEFSIIWGEERDTIDAEGKILNASDARPTKVEILDVISDFIGDIWQVPPKYSAIKIDGKRSYDLARKNEDFEIDARIVSCLSLDLIEFGEESCLFRATVGKGFYIRSLTRDISSRLGVFGYVGYLKRFMVGEFCLNNSVNWVSIKETGLESLKGFLLPPQVVLRDIVALTVSEQQVKKLRYGQSLGLEEFLDKFGCELFEDSIVSLMFNKILIAIAVVNGSSLKPVRIFNIYSI